MEKKHKGSKKLFSGPSSPKYTRANTTSVQHLRIALVQKSPCDPHPQHFWCLFSHTAYSYFPRFSHPLFPFHFHTLSFSLRLFLPTPLWVSVVSIPSQNGQAFWYLNILTPHVLQFWEMYIYGLLVFINPLKLIVCICTLPWFFFYDTEMTIC